MERPSIRDGMKLKLIFVDCDRRNHLTVVGEEFLEGESEKPLTKHRVLKMVKRFHPEFRTSGVIDVSRFQESSGFNAEWCVHSKQLGSNLWRYVYAARVENDALDYRVHRSESEPETLNEQ
jgi:hypothetical protein